MAGKPVHNTFLASNSTLAEAQAVLSGIPLDVTASFRPGTRFGPQSIRFYSHVLEEYSLPAGRSLEDINLHDAGDICLTGSLQNCLNTIREACRRLTAAGKFPVFLGGEHLLSLPVVEALTEKYPGLAVLQFDAHADLRDEYEGRRYSHATVMRRISELIGARNLFQVGIRSASREEAAYGLACGCFETEPAEGMRIIKPKISGRPVYITIDIDVLDPSEAPGTGTPEPGGIRFGQLMAALAELKGEQVVGMDLVETCPLADESGRTSVAAAKIVRDALLLLLPRT